MLGAWFKIVLWKRILLALILGVVVGMLWGEGAASIKWLGDLFIRLIRMVVVPLILTTLISGVVAMGDPKKLGSIGIKTLGMYMGTTAVAIMIGLTLATIVQPGAGVELSGAIPQIVAAAKPLAERLIGIVPTNPIAALAASDVLAVIFFSIMVGAAMLVLGERAAPMARVIDAGAEIMLLITHMVMEVAPFGVFALIAWVAGTQGVEALLDVIPLALCIIGGCLLHMLLTHGFIMRVLLRLPVSQFFRGALDAQMVAFSTSSSSATLPVTMSVAEDNLGVKKPVASSVLPLGATINMDGSGLYVGIVAIFAAQAFGISLSLLDYGLIALSTTLVSIGTAAVPSASLFLLAAVLSVIGVDAAQTAIVVGFLLPFDRPLDMLRTVVNVTGDLSVATTVGKWEGEFDEERFRADPQE